MPSYGIGLRGRGLGLLCGTGLALGSLVSVESLGPARAGETAPSATAKPAAPEAVTKPAAGGSPRVALTTTTTHAKLKPDYTAKSKFPVPTSIRTAIPDEEPIARALRTIKTCQDSYEKVRDYTCTFYKRELVRGRMTPLFVMQMKARSSPRSIYFKFEDPYRGREAIYVEGRNGGKILAHEVGLTRLLAGTLEIHPTSARALEENRHPITDAGIGAMIDTIARRWAVELRPDEAIMLFDSEIMIGPRPCLLVESIHPRREPGFNFHKVRLFIDAELHLPIRFEGYDWPREEDGAPELVEEYSFIDLKLNVGLGDLDFDTANRAYSFGRF